MPNMGGVEATARSLALVSTVKVLGLASLPPPFGTDEDPDGDDPDGE